MSLSNSTLQSVEHYGGIEMKRNYRRFFSGGLGISLVLHLAIIGLCLCYQWLTSGKDVIYPHEIKPGTTVCYRPASLHGSLDSTSFKFLVPPVPVPAAAARYAVLPLAQDLSGDRTYEFVKELEEPNSELSIGGGKGSQSLPTKDEWVEVSDEPKAIVDVQSLVEYPRTAKKTVIEGRVVVSALIDIDGSVLKVDIEKSDHPWLDQAAVEAMRQARFVPAKQGEVPVRVWYTQTIRFTLDK